MGKNNKKLLQGQKDNSRTLSSELMQWKPVLKKTIYFNDLYLDSEGKGKWIVGDTDTDVQFLISASQQEFFSEVFKMLDGKNSLEKIASVFNIDSRRVLSVVKVLYEKNMLADKSVPSDKKSFNEVDRYSIPIFKYKFSQIKNKEKVILVAKVIYDILNIFVIANIFLFLFLNLKDNFSLFKDITLEKAFAMGNSKSNELIGYLVVNIGMVFMFTLHELGHILLGLKNGIQPDRFSFVLFLGFIPMFYVKNKNIYTLNRKSACSVLLAGVYINFLLAFLFMNFYILFGNDLFKIIALSNIRLIIVNLWPLNLSDGYYIFALLKRNPNMRMKMHYAIAEPKKLLSLSSYERIYIIFSVFVMLFMIYTEIVGVMSFLKVNKSYSRIIVIILIVSYVIFLHLFEKRTLYKRGKSE